MNYYVFYSLLYIAYVIIGGVIYHKKYYLEDYCSDYLYNIHNIHNYNTLEIILEIMYKVILWPLFLFRIINKIYEKYLVSHNYSLIMHLILILTSIAVLNILLNLINFKC